MVSLAFGLMLLPSSAQETEEPEGFALRLPAAVSVATGEEALFAVSIRRRDYQGRVTLVFRGLPVGVTIEPPFALADGQLFWRGRVRAAPGAARGVFTVSVRSQAGSFIQDDSFALIVTGPPATEEPSKPEELVFSGPFASPPNAPPPIPVSPSAPPAEPWLLMKLLQGTAPGIGMETERIRMYGWVDMSYTASSDAKTNLPMAQDYVANDFLLQQFWLRFERAVVTSGTSSPSFGWRIDQFFGSDYRFTLPRGLLDDQLTGSDGRPNRYGYDPVQFYAEAYFPTIGAGMDLKVGRFFAQYGVESIPSIDNFFESHVYTYQYDPFTQMGILATTKLNDTWSYQLGLVNGNDVFINPADSPYGIGSVKWAAPTRPDTVLVSWVLGSGRYNASRDFHNPEIVDFIYTRKLNARTNYVFEALYGCTYNVPEIGFANWNGIVNWLYYDFTPRLTGGVRLEFFDDAQGDRTGYKGLYTDFTAGVNFRLRKDIVFRPELRTDVNDQSRPFEGHNSLFTACADLIVRW